MITATDDIIIDAVQVIGTNLTVYKAWRKVERDHGPEYRTITYFNGVLYGRMGTEAFICPPMPEYKKAAAKRAGRLNCEVGGTMVTREWRYDQLARHRATCVRAAHDVIMNDPGPKGGVFDDNGTVIVFGA